MQEGAVLEGDVVKVQMRDDAELEQKFAGNSDSGAISMLGWIISHPLLDSKNDVVVV